MKNIQKEIVNKHSKLFRILHCNIFENMLVLQCNIWGYFVVKEGIGRLRWEKRLMLCLKNLLTNGKKKKL